MQHGTKRQYAAPKAPERDVEPLFDTDRVVWDAYYRRRVIDQLRSWRRRQHSIKQTNGPSASAA